LQAKEAEHTDLGEVDSSKQVLPRAGIQQAFCVDFGIVDVDQVISESQVYAVETDAGKAKRDRCDNTIGYAFNMSVR
jgi:hypothetical protein